MRVRKYVQVFCFTSAIIAICLPVLSAPSGLNVIPTADVLDQGELSLEIESAGPGSPWGSDSDSFALIQFGIGHGVELGLDRTTSGASDYWLNVKWCVLEESESSPAIAIGTQELSSGERHQPFVAATKSFDALRLHSGLIRIESKTRWMLGVEHPIGSRLSFQADYINGAENSATFGVAIDINDSLSLTVARSLGNSSDTDDGHIVNLTWSKSLK